MPGDCAGVAVLASCGEAGINLQPRCSRTAKSIVKASASCSNVRVNTNATPRAAARVIATCGVTCCGCAPASLRNKPVVRHGENVRGAVSIVDISAPNVDIVTTTEIMAMPSDPKIVPMVSAAINGERAIRSIGLT